MRRRPRPATLPFPLVAVRAATDGDVPEIAALIRALAAYEHLEHEVVLRLDDLRDALFGADAIVQAAVAEEDDEIVGFALWYRTFSTFTGRPGIWLEDLFVRPDHRGRGHGLALLHHVRAQTGGRLEWAVLDWNVASIELYESLGARPVAGWTRYRWTPP
jgi:GNAT superfamily N-acetyltransferase